MDIVSNYLKDALALIEESKKQHLLSKRRVAEARAKLYRSRQMREVEVLMERNQFSR